MPNRASSPVPDCLVTADMDIALTAYLTLGVALAITGWYVTWLNDQHRPRAERWSILSRSLASLFVLFLWPAVLAIVLIAKGADDDTRE